MKSPDGDSDETKYQAFFEQMKNQPGFKELFRSMVSSEETVKTESPSVTTVRQDSTLKATPFDDGNSNDHELKIKNNFIIEERGRSLASQCKFSEAISVLEDFEGSMDDLGMSLLIAECYIQIGRETKAEKALDDAERLLMRNCNIDDVMALSADISQHSNNVRALLLSRIAGEMYKKSSLTPDEKVRGIFRCIANMDITVLRILLPQSFEKMKNMEVLGRNLQALMGSNISVEERKVEAIQALFANQDEKPIEINKRSKIVALDYGISVMEEMLNDLRSMHGADPGNKALKQAMLANMISHTVSKTGMHSKSLKILQTGLAQLRKHFGKNVNQHQIYIKILVNIGADLHNTERFRETEKIQLEALDEIDHVLDFSSEEERQAEIKRIRDVLRLTRSVSKRT